jgi:hypothetical protein
MNTVHDEETLVIYDLPWKKTGIVRTTDKIIVKKYTQTYRPVYLQL